MCDDVAVTRAGPWLVALVLGACRWDFALAPAGAGPDGADAAGGAVDAAEARADSVPLDDAGRGDPVGSWVAERATRPGEAERFRDDLVAGVRLELVMSDTPLEGDLRWITLDAGTIAGASVLKLTTTVVGDRWILDASGDGLVQVMVATWLDADRVELRYDPADPDNVGAAPFGQLTVRRAPARDQRLAGSHRLQRYRYPGGPEQAAGSCEPLAGAARRVDGLFDVDPRLILDSVTTLTDYAAGDCTGAGLLSEIGVSGWLELTGTVLDAWLLYSSGERATTRWTLSELPVGWRLERTACAPGGSTACGDLFDVVVLGLATAAR